MLSSQASDSPANFSKTDNFIMGKGLPLPLFSSAHMSQFIAWTSFCELVVDPFRGWAHLAGVLCLPQVPQSKTYNNVKSASCEGAIICRHHISQGSHGRRDADPGGLADFAGHSLEGGAQEIPVLTVPHLHLS
jgi:hypothetical protein